MPKYRKKPVTIDAYQLQRHTVEQDWYAMPAWVRAAYERGDLLFPASGFTVRTLEGLMAGAWGDYLIKGVKDELYPCRKDVFTETYALVEEEG